VVYPWEAYTGLYGRVYDVSEDVSEERLSVGEAAARLGVTRDAIHKRIRRDSIRHEQGEDGRFYVYVDTSTIGADISTRQRATDEKGTGDVGRPPESPGRLPRGPKGKSSPTKRSGRRTA